MNLEVDPELTVLVDISDAEFRDLAGLVYDQFGINLTDKKKSLVRGRLNKVLKSRGLASFGQYLELVRRDATGMVLVELIDRISTNHTFFFREADHFTFFQETVLPQLGTLVPSPSELRIWCAGCATGEEAYTLAMLCRDWAARSGFHGEIKILATDISVTALETAILGEYNDERVRLVPEGFKHRYLASLGPDRWSIVPELRRMVLFKRLNFMDPSFPFRNLFHAVFCRNVMIYFDRQTKVDLVRRLSATLFPGQYFFIGHSETLGRDTYDFDYVKPSVYRRRGA
ncbi:MAG TPA: CheR family methyltransferase [Spirochaetia bacterium]|nr:CheR family methyltransferase [Spirochaetia bacterium]